MKTVIIKSFEDYTDHVEAYKGSFFFRGQANCNWSMIPSLFRVDAEQEAKIIADNTEACTIIDLFRMQHYGIPTRLLDLTVSQYSALLFAVDSENEQSCDGTVYVFKKGDTLTSKDVRLQKFCTLLQTSDSVANCPPEFFDFVINDHIIQYGYDYSYSNPRALIQGGTSLLVGLGYDGTTLSRSKEVKLDDLIIEKIVIPHDLKTQIKNQLSVLGYCSDVIYERHELLTTTSDFNVIQEKTDIQRRAGFAKVIVQYSVSCVYFNMDALTDRICTLYESFFMKYGANARIWLFFYFDQNDVDKANWICRTEWQEGDTWRIKWNNEYYSKRLSYINEEISFDMAYKMIYPLLSEARTMYGEAISAFEKDMSIFQDNIVRQAKRMESIFLRSGDVPYVEVKFEPFMEKALAYISTVEQLYTDISIYSMRGESAKFISYWFDVLMKKCVECERELIQICNELGIDIR